MCVACEMMLKVLFIKAIFKLSFQACLSFSLITFGRYVLRQTLLLWREKLELKTSFLYMQSNVILSAYKERKWNKNCFGVCWLNETTLTASFYVFYMCASPSRYDFYFSVKAFLPSFLMASTKN